MAAVIGNDILDIGSSKNRKRQEGFVAPSDLTLGRPGQFEVPNVPDVRNQCEVIFLQVFLRLNLILFVCCGCMSFCVFECSAGALLP